MGVCPVKAGCVLGPARAGNFLPWLDNLQAVYYDYFVRYLVEVVRWYRDTHGIIFRCALPCGCLLWHPC